MKKLIPILILVVIIAIVGLIYLLTQSESTTETNTNSQTSVEEFITSYQLKNAEIDIYLEDPTNDLEFFLVAFGEEVCDHMGCHKIYVGSGLKHKNKIGFYKVDSIVNPQLYDFDNADNYLFSEEFFTFFEKENESAFRTFENHLAKDSDVPKETLLTMTRGLAEYISPSLASNLLENSKVQKDRKILEIISSLPGSESDVYELWRNRAKELLESL